MQIKSIEIEGFKSYTKKQVLDFTKYDKLVFVTGENLIEPTLSANGVGKSSLFEAISWVLFGKTSTNLKAGDIKNWDTNIPCSVTLAFDKGNSGYILKRTWNPNTLIINGEIVSQTDLESLIGLNFESFSYSVFISQFGEKFVDYTPSEKMKVFSQIMGSTLTMWDKLSDASKSKKDEFDGELNSLKLDIAKKSGEILSLENLDYNSLIVDFETWRGDNLEKLNTEIEKLLKSATPIYTAKELVEELTLTIHDLKSNIDITNNEALVLAESINSLKSEFQTLEFRIGSNDKLSKKLKSLDAVCPTCLQPVDTKLLTVELEKLEEDTNTLKKECGIYESDIADNTLKYKSLIKTVKDLDTLRSLKQAELITASKKVTELEVLEASNTKAVSKLKQEVIELINTDNPYIKQKLDNNIVIENLKTQLTELENKYVSVKEDYEIYKYWATGFKEIKLMLTGEALKEFEVEVNNNLQKLGLTEWRIKLDIDSENKSGTVKKGFTILVQSPINKSLVPFECWSGGEAQRIRLAVSLGLVDFVRNRSLEPCNILVMDEPTQFLSDTGIEDLLLALKDKAIADDITIFLIDHRNLKTSGVFEHMINLIKDNNGTVIL